MGTLSQLDMEPIRASGVSSSRGHKNLLRWWGLQRSSCFSFSNSRKSSSVLTGFWAEQWCSGGTMLFALLYVVILDFCALKHFCCFDLLYFPSCTLLKLQLLIYIEGWAAGEGSRNFYLIIVLTSLLVCSWTMLIRYHYPFSLAHIINAAYDGVT